MIKLQLFLKGTTAVKIGSVNLLLLCKIRAKKKEKEWMVWSVSPTVILFHSTRHCICTDFSWEWLPKRRLYTERGTNGSISSPEYPLSYPDSVKCTWIIEVPEGYRVRLEFQSFQLETCTIPSVCTCDHVEVRDGRDATGNSLERSCGDKKPSHLRSSGRFMWIEFESDSKTTRNGFHAIFNALCKCPVERSAFSLWKKKSNIKINLSLIYTFISVEPCNNEPSMNISIFQETYLAVL